MYDRWTVTRVHSLLGGLACLLLAGCAAHRDALPEGTARAEVEPPASPAAEAPPTPAVEAPTTTTTRPGDAPTPETPAEQPVASVVAEPPTASATPTAPTPPAAAAAPAMPAPPAVAKPPRMPAPAAATPSTAPSTATVPPKATAPAPATVATGATPPAPPQPRATPTTVPASPPAPALDLDSLEKRLRQTKAIGVMTKISLKNQVDDLLSQFRAYHKRQTKASLAELRESYDLLLLKVLSLLQDSDPSLARDIVRSRAAIWGILSNPQKFSEAKLMAGVIP